MSLSDELEDRLAQRRSTELGGLSQGAYVELLQAVCKDPASFVSTPAEQAFLLIVQALRRIEQARHDAEFLDDDAFFDARQRYMARLSSDCAEALALDEDCVDARLLAILASDLIPDKQLDALCELLRDINGRFEADASRQATGDAWDDLQARPYLRVQDAISRTCIDSARYRMANSYGQQLLTFSPCDALGARHTCAIALARLEDEEGFEALEARIGHKGDSWQQLSRTVLFYKLGRMPAARRSLRGYAELCEGGAYALLRPVMVDVYLPSRPETKPYSYHEATLAVNEADPIVCDVPDFCGWAESHDWFASSARSFADRNGYMW